MDALEVMRRLLAPESAGWLSENFLLRIDRDILKDWGALLAITEARKTVARRTARLAQIVGRFSLWSDRRRGFTLGPLAPCRERRAAPTRTDPVLSRALRLPGAAPCPARLSVARTLDQLQPRAD